MARKRRPVPAARMEAAPAAAAPFPVGPAAAPVSAGPAAPPPREPARDGGAVAVLAIALFLAPVLGVPGEEMLQDTLKSIVIAFGALLAALLFVLAQRARTEPLRWHAVLWLPLLLMAYALGSMAWSHTYLGGVEAVRWFVFTVIAWLGLNTFTRERLPLLAWAIHGAGLIASLWAMAQFWGGMELFPQGPQPASTFINRNFFAEFAVCTLPFGVLLLARARASAMVALLAASLGLVLTALLMTGTRSALLALGLLACGVLPLFAWRCRGRLAWSGWSRGLRLLAAGVLAGTVLALGFIPTANPKIVEDHFGATPVARGLFRAQSLRPGDGSIDMRLVMWRATLRVIADRPLTGVGAGAWESEIPRYQAEGSQLETDYYVHNEYLQLLAEYGVAGWVFLLLLFAYLLLSFWRSWAPATPEAQADQPWRAVLLASLLALLVVSNAGFPWRMAATGALFAAALGGLAASDARAGAARRLLAVPLRWSPRIAHAALAATGVGLVLATLITQAAAESERKLVGAARIAMSITASGNPNDPRLAPLKKEMLQLVREGIAINPHYRKITPIVADELARWGDWANATWIWDSVLASRPYVVAIISNAARGYASTGRTDRALAYLERAKRIQPRAPAVRSLEVILVARGGDEARATRLAREAYEAGIKDYDLVNSYFLLARGAKDFALARQLLEERMRTWPDSRARGLVQLGHMASEQNQAERALQYFREGLAAATPAERPALAAEIPPALRAQVAASGAQTSANSR